uniref:Uncharacterized protein n=1 Tax=Octopus bimaculoides TaxID=37653 RepID=A0A0L8GYK2_OCTBM
MQSVCICEQHQNAKLIVAAIPGSHNYKDLLGKMACSMSNHDYMLLLCESCPGKIVFEQHLLDVFSSHDFDSSDLVMYKQWAHIDRTALFA